eukprot:Sspe_Gene.56438::Locus_31047_Transcript_1_1_Confidence_1.000_Length_2428::g.56438::m.56438
MQLSSSPDGCSSRLRWNERKRPPKQRQPSKTSRHGSALMVFCLSRRVLSVWGRQGNQQSAALPRLPSKRAVSPVRGEKEVAAISPASESIALSSKTTSFTATPRPVLQRKFSPPPPALPLHGRVQSSPQRTRLSPPMKARMGSISPPPPSVPYSEGMTPFASLASRYRGSSAVRSQTSSAAALPPSVASEHVTEALVKELLKRTSDPALVRVLRRAGSPAVQELLRCAVAASMQYPSEAAALAVRRAGGGSSPRVCPVRAPSPPSPRPMKVSGWSEAEARGWQQLSALSSAEQKGHSDLYSDAARLVHSLRREGFPAHAGHRRLPAWTEDEHRGWQNAVFFAGI